MSRQMLNQAFMRPLPNARFIGIIRSRLVAGLFLLVLLQFFLVACSTTSPCKKTAECGEGQFCRAEYCVPLVVEGNACTATANCTASLVCTASGAAKACTSVKLCTLDADCTGGLGCYTQSDSREKGVCSATREGPKFDTNCFVRVDEAEISGKNWDSGALGNAVYPDPYVQVKIGTKIYQTPTKTDVSKAVWTVGNTSQPHSFGDIARMTVTIFDADLSTALNPDSDDLMGTWTLDGHIAWTAQGTEQGLQLKTGGIDLALTIVCN